MSETLLLFGLMLQNIVIISLLYKISRGQKPKISKSDILFFSESLAHEQRKYRNG